MTATQSLPYRVGRPRLQLTGWCRKCQADGVWGVRTRIGRDGAPYPGRYCLTCDRRRHQKSAA